MDSQGRPTGGPNSFIFMQFSAKNWQNNTNLGIDAPPSGKSWIHHCTCKSTVNKLNFSLTRKISMFTKETIKFWSLVKTGLADVDGFGICIQVYVWPDSDHWFSTLLPKGITSLAKPVFGFQQKSNYIHEKRLPPVVKETKSMYCTTGTALPNE